MRAIFGLLGGALAPTAVVETSPVETLQSMPSTQSGARRSAPVVTPIANDPGTDSGLMVDGKSDAKRRADAAMELLEESTPEM